LTRAPALIVRSTAADTDKGGRISPLLTAQAGKYGSAVSLDEVRMNDRQRYRLGMAAYEAGRFAEAIRHLTPLASGKRKAQALLSRFYLGQAHHHLAVQLLERRRFAEAAGHFQAAAGANPAGGGVARFLAACHVGTGQFDLAAREFETLLYRDPDDAGVRIRLALAQWKQGSPVEAAATLREGIRRKPDHVELHYQLGVMLAAEDDPTEAERLFEKTIALEPRHAGAYERLAQCCSVDNRHERALRYLERAHELDPANPRIAWQLSLLAHAMTQAGQKPTIEWRRPKSPHQLDQAAVQRLGEIIAAEPDFLSAFLSLPESEVDREVFSTLAATLEHALEKHPEFADLHYHCGAVYRRLGRNREALEHAEHAVEINPRYVSALILLARLYGQTDRWAAGVERLEQAIRSGGDYPDVHYLIGQLCQKGGQLDRARRAYQRALALNQDYRAAREALAALPLPV